MRFADRSLKALALEPGQKDLTRFDDDCPGLGVRLTAKGTRAFIIQWTDPATKRKVREPIGIWGSITIDQARIAARARLGDVAKGIDPRAIRSERKAAHEAERARNVLTLDALVTDWATKHLAARRPRYRNEAQRALRYAFATYLKRSAAKLSRAEVITTLDKLPATIAGRTKAYGHACFKWAMQRERVPQNPFAGVPVPTGATERDRVLTDGETAEIVAAATSLPYPFGPFYRVALLTLQRREDVAAMRWSELSADFSLWTIPAARMKNRKAHDIHLAEPVRVILRELLRTKKQDLVFSTTGKNPVSGFSRAKSMLDAAVVAARAKAAQVSGRDADPSTPWRLHDFRRTGVSTMAALGIDSIVADKILAHKPAKLKGVAAVYQRHEFANERRLALEAWAAHVERQPVTNVTYLPTAKERA